MIRASILLAALGVIVADPVLAQNYEPGHGALQLFNDEGRGVTPAWVRIWVIIMFVVFAAGLLFVRKHVEARWAVGGFVLMVGAAMLLTSALGVRPLGGLFALLHIIFWSPALYLLLSRRPFMQGRSLFAIWSGLMTAVIVFSFVFDVRDAGIYLHHILAG